MAKKGGKRGGSSAARSAAAKKGWETRRRSGAKAKPTKPTARKATAPSKPKQATGRRGMPKTTSARGRALTNQRRAADLVRASRGGKGPSAKAVRSVLTAQRARAFYAATGGGTKRSAVKPKSAAKVGKQIRAQGRAKATAARARVAGRPRSRVVANPAAQRPVAMPRGGKTGAPGPARRNVDYGGAVAAVRARDKSIRRLEQNQYANTAGGNFAYNSDLHISRRSSGAYVREQLRGTLARLRNTQALSRNYNYDGRPDLTAAGKAQYKSTIPRIRQEVVRLTRTLRAFYPAYQQETIKRVEAARARSAARRRR